MEAAAAIGVIACLVLLFIWTSWRWGPPRLYVRGAFAAWLIATVLAVVALLALR